MPTTALRPSERKELTEMIRQIAISAVSALVLGTGLSTGIAFAAGEGGHTEDVAFSFEGPFGTFDEHQLQRGLQIYTEVCSACHGLKFVPLRSLSDEGGPHLPEDQVRAYAANFSAIDKETKEERAALPTDNFPANTGVGAPDLSLMAKARAGFHGPYGLGINQFFKGIGGPEHIYSILTGYTGEEKTEAGTTFYENHAFSTGWIAMAPPLADDAVTFQDGHEASLHHMAEDVSAFLMWTAEPKMMARKQAGFKAVIFLILLTSLLYLTNKRLWAGIKGKKHA
jgi:ubiquinol-cytochrome c reductase cytochrome c1 subunit